MGRHYTRQPLNPCELSLLGSLKPQFLCNASITKAHFFIALEKGVDLLWVVHPSVTDLVSGDLVVLTLTARI
jgi:hypothetical protein